VAAVPDDEKPPRPVTTRAESPVPHGLFLRLAGGPFWPAGELEPWFDRSTGLTLGVGHRWSGGFGLAFDLGFVFLDPVAQVDDVSWHMGSQGLLTSYTRPISRAFRWSAGLGFGRHDLTVVTSQGSGGESGFGWAGEAGLEGGRLVAVTCAVRYQHATIGGDDALDSIGGLFLALGIRLNQSDAPWPARKRGPQALLEWDPDAPPGRRWRQP
jgi:hypothetical protein